MFGKSFIALAILIASPALASAQDLFFSFEPDSLVTESFANFNDTSGSVYIFSDGLFGFDAIDLDFITSNSGVIQFTGGEAFNPTFEVIGGRTFNASEVTVEANGDRGNLFAVNITGNGINPALTELFNPAFEPNVGPNGAVLLARLDFDLVGPGFESFNLDLGNQGAIRLPDQSLDPTFGSASLTGEVVVPLCIGEPELILGDVNLDGFVDAFDIAPFISILAAGFYQFEADCNEDSVVNFLDIRSFVSLIGT
jgi:hypothetical protein